ncbi:MAG: tyrosine-protein phosphatase [Candidatus Aminicenantia bacterium]
MIDLHTHILPQLDDGSSSFEESVKMAEIAVADGITKIAATPHLFRNNYFYSELSIIEERRKELNSFLVSRKIPLELLSGAEVHLTHNILDQINENRKYLTINNTSYLFIELPSDYIFPRIKELFFDVMTERITPIITHPERNSVFFRKPEILYQLIHMGAMAQLNAGSLTGIYGMGVYRLAVYFLKMNYIHLIGSDAHNSRSKPPVLSKAVEAASKIIGQEKASALVEENPRAIIRNEQLPYYEEPINPIRERKLRIKIPEFINKLFK